MSTTKKLLAALALTLVSAAATSRAEAIVGWASLAVDAAARVVALGPFMDHNG